MRILKDQAALKAEGGQQHGLDPALLDYILLLTILVACLVAFLAAAAQSLSTSRRWWYWD